MKIIIYQENEYLIAQCLEKDIISVNKDNDIPALLTDLCVQINVNASVTLPPAPEKFHKMWARGEDLLFENADSTDELLLRQAA